MKLYVELGRELKVLVDKKKSMYVTGSIPQIYTSCNCDCKTSSISPILDKSAKYMSVLSENHSGSLTAGRMCLFF